MSARHLVSAALLLVVAASAGLMIYRQTAETPAVEAKTPEAGVSQTVVYYFHTTQRCVTCRKLETFTEAALKAQFADALSEGEVIWRPVNTDAPEAAHFLKDYQLVTKAVVLSKVEDGKEVRWKNLDQIWRKVSDEVGYQDYIETELRAFLEAG